MVNIMKKIMQNRHLIIGVVLYIFNIILLFGITNFKINIKFLITLFIEFALIISLYFFLYKKNWSIEKKFIIFFFIIGLFYLFLFPVGSLPDETNHFMRSYEISKGNLVSKKCKVKNGYAAGCNLITQEIADTIINSGATYETNKKVSSIRYDKNSKKMYIEFTNTSFYSFVCYIPQAAGIFVARLFNLPIIYWDYMARLFNFIMFTIFIYISIKIIPYKKNVIMFISLIPITLQSAVSISADCMTIATAILLISYTLYLNRNDDKLSRKEIIILFILSTMLSLCKIVYLPLCLFPLLLKKEKFGSRKLKYIILGLMTLFVIFINFIWLKIASEYLLSISAGSNPSEQISMIIHKPWIFMKAIYNTAVYNFDYYTYSQLGSSLGTFAIDVSPVYIKLNLIILVSLLLYNNDAIIDKKDKIISLILYFCVVFLIYSSLYVQWTSVGSNIIDGIQGRYFLPILPLLFIVSNNKFFKISNNKFFNNKLMLLILIFENIYVLTYLISYY